MKPIPKIITGLCCGGWLAAVVFAKAANLPADWPLEQSFSIATSGLVKIRLPVQTLGTARPGLEDLRLYDEAGNEVAYVIERSAPASRLAPRAKSFQSTLHADTTAMTFETDASRPFEGLTLETPAANFIKAASVESSNDDRSWRMLVQNQPIFREPNGAERLYIAIPPSTAKWFRITVDDRRSAPIPFTGVELRAEPDAPTPGEWMSTAITARDESPGETRLTLDLGAANLTIGSVQIETPEPLLTRLVTVAIPRVADGSIGEETIGRGTIYRIATEGQTPAESLTVPLERQIESRELFLLIKNGDSRSLRVSGVRIERRPVSLVFLAQQAGVFHLLMGNRQCAAPSYDLSRLNLNWASIPVQPVKISPPTANPQYLAPEVLPGITPAGATLDISDWGFRKPVRIAGAGVQQLELDLDVLAEARPDFADMRLVAGTNQVPFLIERTSINRALTPEVTATNEARMSRWRLVLPHAHLPVTKLTGHSPSSLFDRTMSLYEELTDERGDKYRHPLGTAEWRHMPDETGHEFSLTLDGEPAGNTLYLETENGDNPPLVLDTFKVYYPVTRVLFKGQPEDKLFLYYGNPQAAAPSYDLNLVAGELLAADKKTASLGGEERLKKSPWHETLLPGQGGIVLWTILALVVVVLLVIVSKLLPKAPV